MCQSRETSSFTAPAVSTFPDLSRMNTKRMTLSAAPITSAAPLGSCSHAALAPDHPTLPPLPPLLASSARAICPSTNDSMAGLTNGDDAEVVAEADAEAPPATGSFVVVATGRGHSAAASFFRRVSSRAATAEEGGGASSSCVTSASLAPGVAQPSARPRARRASSLKRTSV
jgi:hypothetical protein